MKEKVFILVEEMEIVARYNIINKFIVEYRKGVHMIEVKLLADKKVIVETLSRIGIANKKKKILFPSCYIYEQDDKNYIVHFKELFALTRENSYNNVCLEDELRLKATVFNLKNWGLIEVDDSVIDPHNTFLFVLPFKEKNQWQISHKYNTKNLYNVKKD